jgi:hypothetical protein
MDLPITEKSPCALCERPDTRLFRRGLCRSCHRKLSECMLPMPPNGRWSPDPMIRLLTFLRSIPPAGRLLLHQLLLQANASDPVIADLPSTAEGDGSRLQPRESHMCEPAESSRKGMTGTEP